MPLDLSLQTLNDTAEPGEPRQVRLYRLLKNAILDGVIPNEHDAAFAFMLEKAEKMGLTRVNL